MSNDPMTGQVDPIERLRRLVGTQKRVAEALDMAPEQITRLARGQYKRRAYLTAIAELLEALPRDRWPARWQANAAPSSKNVA